VIVHLLDLAEGRATAARDKANKVSLAAAAKVSDLDQAETPESIMLSTMTIEGKRQMIEARQPDSLIATPRETTLPCAYLNPTTYDVTLHHAHRCQGPH